MYDRNNKAVLRGKGNVDTVSRLKSNDKKASNQVQFTQANPRAVPVKPNSEAAIGPNTKGTGREEVPVGIALSGKRKLPLKVQGNFN